LGSKYLNKLEQILIAKISGRFVSHKLKKLAQRNSLLPEEGDMILLKEAIVLHKQGEDVALLSFDKDFVDFAVAIKDEFAVDVFVG
jgi:hypothetical protein